MPAPLRILAITRSQIRTKFVYPYSAELFGCPGYIAQIRDRQVVLNEYFTLHYIFKNISLNYCPIFKIHIFIASTLKVSHTVTLYHHVVSKASMAVGPPFSLIISQ